MRSRLFVLLSTFALACCVRYPDPYPPPIQQHSTVPEKPDHLKHHISMNDPAAPAQFVSDVVPELKDDAWRWTMQRPTFRFELPTTAGLSFEMDYTVPDVTFKKTGPVNITVWIEGHKLAVIYVPKDQKTVWRKPVPAAWLTTKRPVTVKLEIDKMWVADHHEMERGFIISSIGFVQ
jgi:hypothetical protein